MATPLNTLRGEAMSYHDSKFEKDLYNIKCFPILQFFFNQLQFGHFHDHGCTKLLNLEMESKHQDKK